MIKIAFLSIHPSPYRDPFLNRLAEVENVHLDVFEYESVDRGHNFWNLQPPKYRHFLFKKMFKFIGRGIHPGTLKLLIRQYDYYVIPGTLYLSSLFLLIMLPILRRKVIFYADSISDATSSCLVRIIKQWVYNKVSFVMVPGQAGADFFCEKYGFNYSVCLLGGYALDVLHIQKQIHLLGKSKREQILKQLCLPKDKKIFMMCANMQRNRDYPMLVKAFKLFALDKKDVHLLMIGGGVDASQIDQMIANVATITRVDHCSYGELMQFYSIIYCYLHTGCEPYSTAITLGAIAGVPLISSLAVGASHDYVQNGLTGVLVNDRNNLQEWATAMQAIYNWDAEKRSFAYDHLQVLVKKLSPETTVPVFVEALHKCNEKITSFS